MDTSKIAIISQPLSTDDIMARLMLSRIRNEPPLVIVRHPDPPEFKENEFLKPEFIPVSGNRKQRREWKRKNKGSDNF